MSVSLVDKLLESFDKLDDCITMTQSALEAKGSVPSKVINRINQYADVVQKQRRLAASLRKHLEQQDWTEVSRHVRLINGLSSMIRDDAQEILRGVNTDFAAETEDLSRC